MASEEPGSGESIGERLRRLRTERGLSQRDLSAPGVSYAYISRIEAGARRPSVKALRLLAEKLSVSAAYLETGSAVHDFERRELDVADAALTLRLDAQDTAAEERLARLLAESVGAGDLTAATRARVALGLRAFDRCDHARAAELLGEAVESGLLSPASRPDVFATLGRTLGALGQSEQAAALYARCRAQLAEEAPGDIGASVRFASYLSQSLTEVGDVAGAQSVLRDALRHSDRVADPYARIGLYRALGRSAARSGRAHVALEYFRRALALLEAADDTVHLARAHVSCAAALVVGAEPAGAAEHLAVAELLLGPDPRARDLVIVRRLQGSIALLNGDQETAIERAQEALRLAGDLLPGDRGQAWLVIAEARAAQGSVADAERAFEEAAALLEQHGTPRARAACYRAWGRLLRETGREADALDVLERATDLVAEAQPDGAAAAEG